MFTKDRKCRASHPTVESGPGPLRRAGKWRDFYPLPDNQSKMHACFAHVHAFSKSLISIWARWPVGFGAWVSAAPFSAFRSDQPVLPVQPTPTGAFEKVRFAVYRNASRKYLLPARTDPCAARNFLAGTRRRVPARFSSAARWGRQASRDAPKRCARQRFAPERCFSLAPLCVSHI